MTQQQADRIENVAQRQKEIDQEVRAIAGELRSVKLTIMVGWMPWKIQ